MGCTSTPHLAVLEHEVERRLHRPKLLDVGVQAQKPGFKLKALLSFSQSNFETGCFQARVKLAPPYLERRAEGVRGGPCAAPDELRGLILVGEDEVREAVRQDGEELLAAVADHLEGCEVDADQRAARFRRLHRRAGELRAVQVVALQVVAAQSSEPIRLKLKAPCHDFSQSNFENWAL